jgi:hypothetical protein
MINRNHPSDPAQSGLASVLDLIPAAWLLLVITAYSLVVTEDWRMTRAPVPGIAEAERALPPLLCSLVLAAIIRYFWLRNTRARAASEAPKIDARPETSDCP